MVLRTLVEGGGDGKESSAAMVGVSRLRGGRWGVDVDGLGRLLLVGG